MGAPIRTFASRIVVPIGWGERSGAIPIGGVHVDEVAEMAVSEAGGEVGCGGAFFVVRAKEDFGCAQFVGHDLKVGVNEAAWDEFHSAEVRNGDLHRKLIVV